MAQQGLMGATL